MASINFKKLGPGTLTFGNTGTEQNFAVECKKIEIKPDMKDEDATILLSGDSFKPAGEITGEITGTLLQNYDTGSLLHWTWQNNGQTLAFEFKPANTGKMTIKGQCQIRAMAVGGDVNKVNDSDFSFPLVGAALPLMTMAP